jgi:hypothetical protein
MWIRIYRYGVIMMGFKPSRRIWEKVNAAILNENAGETLVTLISGMCSMLVSTGVCADEMQARAHLAAVLLSPDTSDRPGELVPQMHAELARLADGKWLQ